MGERVAREALQHHASLTADGLTDNQAYEICNLRPIPIEQKRWHEQQLATLKKDSGWVQRYFAGDREAVAEMRRHSAGIASPVGTLVEINQWLAAHGRPLVKVG